MQVNGWSLFAFRIFADRLSALKTEVERLRREDAVGYKNHPTTKLLALVYDAITKRVPANPDATEFRLGKTLGKEYTAWRRVKHGLPQRYRLFFRFSSKPVRLVIYAWLNDEATLRKAGANTDAYEVFRRMLERGEVPSSVETLLARSRDL